MGGSGSGGKAAMMIVWVVVVLAVAGGIGAYSLARRRTGRQR